MSKLKIKQIRRANALNYLNGFQIDYQLPSGQTRVWEMVSRGDIARLSDEIENQASYSDGVSIMATDRDRQKIVLIKEYRVTAGNYLYALPAGLVDAGETIEQAAIREFKEETGLALEVVNIAKPRYTSVGLSNEKINIVYGYYNGRASAHFSEESEDIEPLIVDRATAIEILQNREVPIRTALLLEAFLNIDPFNS